MGLVSHYEASGFEFGRDNSGKITAAADSALKINAEATSSELLASWLMPAVILPLTVI